MIIPELVVRWSGGSLNLHGWNSGPHGDVKIEAFEGTSLGNIEAVRRALRTALLDGSRSTKDRDNNRTIPLKLKIKAPGYSALVWGEQQLDLIDGRRCELVWTPPAKLGVAPTVFVVDYADLTHDTSGQDWDLGYARGELRYNLTLSTLPHAYADSWITMPALVQGSSVPVTVDDCSSTTGWTATGATLSTSAGKLVITPEAGSTTMTATRTGPVDLTTDRYLTAWGNRPDKVEVANGSTWRTLALRGMDGNYHVYDGTSLADPTVDALRFTWVAGSKGGFVGALTAMAFVDIRKQSGPRSTAARQQTRAVEVPGSRRTPASLLVQSPTSPLGIALIYGGPQYNPAISRGATHTRATTSSTLSGSQSTLDSGSAIAFEVPATDFYTGSHSMFVCARPVAGGVTTTGTLTATIQLRGATGGIILETVRTQALTWAAGEVKVDLLGSVDLPGAALPPGSLTYVRVELGWVKDAPAPDERNLYVDEVLFFNRTLGRFVIANAGLNRKIWVDAANLDVDHDVVYAGSGPKHDAAPMSSLETELPAWSGALSMTPGTTHLYVGTTGALDTTVEATFRPAGNTHMPVLVV